MNDDEPAEAPDDQLDNKDVPANDPTEYLPVMRHHLHEVLWAVHMALSYIQASDLVDSYRQGQTIPTESPLARQLERSHATLLAYLGLLDQNNGDGRDEPVSEE